MSSPQEPHPLADQEEGSDPVEEESPFDEKDEDQDENEEQPSPVHPSSPSCAQEPPLQPVGAQQAPIQVPDRYEMEKCTIQISITLLEGSNQPQERSVILGIRNDADVPLITMVRLADLEPLPAPIASLLARLKTSLPQRKQAMQEQLEKAQREQVAKAAKPRTPTSPSTATQTINTSTLPNEKAEEVTPTAQPQQKQPSASKRQVKDSEFEQMTFF